eukprot:4774127-Prymnesium_polylepis.1
MPIDTTNASYVRCALNLLGWELDAAWTATLRAHVNGTRRAEGNGFYGCTWLRDRLQAFRPTRESRGRLVLPSSGATAEFAREYNKQTSLRCGWAPS